MFVCMHLFIVGLPGAGKSTAARLLGAEWGWSVWDLDERVESQVGQSIADFVAERGIEAFREVESACLKEVADCDRPVVVACGGGTPLREENRRFMQAHGETVWLDPGNVVLVDRLRNDGGKRPLLAGVNWDREGNEHLSALREEREAAYAFARFRGPDLEAIQADLAAWARSSR